MSCPEARPRSVRCPRTFQARRPAGSWTPKARRRAIRYVCRVRQAARSLPERRPRRRGQAPPADRSGRDLAAITAPPKRPMASQTLAFCVTARPRSASGNTSSQSVTSCTVSRGTRSNRISPAFKGVLRSLDVILRPRREMPSSTVPRRHANPTDCTVRLSSLDPSGSTTSIISTPSPPAFRRSSSRLRRPVRDRACCEIHRALRGVASSTSASPASSATLRDCP